MTEERFVDYYETLQISRNADQETIERVFRLLAKRYHPDNTSTGDAERFSALADAYHILSDPEERAEYDAHYESGRRKQWSLFFEAPIWGADDDDRVQQWIMSILYRTRRRDSSKPGVGIYELESYLGVAQGQLDYHLWYLKEKGWMMRTDSGQYAITADGIDWIRESDHPFPKDRLLAESNGNSDGEVSPQGFSQPSEESDQESPPLGPEILSWEERVG